jgi:hypothetical protein
MNEDPDQQGSFHTMTVHKYDSRQWIDWIRSLWGMLTRSGDDHPRAVFIAAAGVGILMTMYTTQRAQFEFHHDSLYYWELGRSFIAGDTFSFTNFGDGLRGYLYPFLLFLVQRQASLLGMDPKLLFAVYSALFFTGLSMYLIHWFIEWVFGWKAGIAARLAFAFLLFYFWRGHFLYPLTDFPSLAALLAGIIFLVKGAGAGGRWHWFIFAGIFAGAAMNIRPIYQISVVAMLVFLPFLLRGQGVRSISTSAAAFIVGCAFILSPQIMINKIRHNIISPLVLAHYVGDDSIYEVQLFWGLKTQKYETNVGDDYPWTGVVYAEPLTLELLRETSKERTLSNYLRIVSRNPLEMSMMYFRHFFNGLDIFYSTPYVRNIFAGHSFFSLFNYIIWFAVFRHLLGLRSPGVTPIPLMGAAALILPVAAAVPTVVEVRFFLPVYLLAYAVVCRGFSVNGIPARHRDTSWSLIREFLLCATWILLCFSLSAATVEHLAA